LWAVKGLLSYWEAEAGNELSVPRSENIWERMKELIRAENHSILHHQGVEISLAGVVYLVTARSHLETSEQMNTADFLCWFIAVDNLDNKLVC